MIPVRFYRDDDYIYFNNPDGLTKKIPISDFEAIMSGEGGSGGSLIVTLTVNESDKLTTESSYDDIVTNGVLKGKIPVFLLTSDENGTGVSYLYAYQIIDDGEAGSHRIYVTGAIEATLESQSSTGAMTEYTEPTP